MRRVLYAALLFFLSAGALAKSFCSPVAVEKELLITDLSVVNSAAAGAGGDLSFYSLFKKITQSNGKADTQIRLRDWLGEWKRPFTESGALVTPRSTSSLEWFWPKSADGELSLTQAPFVLSAIVFRPDVVEDDAGSAISGELRFIFNLVDVSSGLSEQFNLIFEFPLRADQNLEWARDIHALGKLRWGTDYNDALVGLLSKLDPRGARLRTNDFFLAFEWDLREFKPDSAGRLRLRSLPKTPRLDFHLDQALTSQLANWIGTNETKIKAGTHEIPAAMQTGNAATLNEGFSWLDPSSRRNVVDDALRSQFSVQTCNGCHSGDTMTRFAHVEARSVADAAMTSQFLKDDLVIRKRIFEDRLCGRAKRAASVMQSRKWRTH